MVRLTCPPYLHDSDDHSGGGRRCEFWCGGVRQEGGITEGIGGRGHRQEIAHRGGDASLNRSLPPPSCVPPLFHHSCHCYYVIFLTRPSRLREQHCPPHPRLPLPHPDRLVRDARGVGWGVQLLLLLLPPQRPCRAKKKKVFLVVAFCQGYNPLLTPQSPSAPPTHTLSAAEWQVARQR